MRLALVQFNPLVGDVTGNARRAGEWIARARAEGADLVVIGRRGRSNLRDLLLGSTAEKVLRELDASLFAAHVAE